MIERKGQGGEAEAKMPPVKVFFLRFSPIKNSTVRVVYIHHIIISYECRLDCTTSYMYVQHLYTSVPVSIVTGVAHMCTLKMCTLML
jgi:hypothetical protein